MGSGVASMCVEVLWRILGFLFSLFFSVSLLSHGTIWSPFLHVIKVMFVKVGILSSLPFFHFFLSKSFFSCSISSSGKHLSCFGLHGLGPKGGIGVLAYIHPTTSPPVLPSTIMGTHSTSTFFYVQHGVPSLSEVPSSPIWGFIPTRGSVLTTCGP